MFDDSKSRKSRIGLQIFSHSLSTISDTLGCENYLCKGRNINIGCTHRAALGPMSLSRVYTVCSISGGTNDGRFFGTQIRSISQDENIVLVSLWVQNQ